MTHPESPLIDIHMPAIRGEVPSGAYVDSRLNNYGRAELILALQGLGAAVVLSRGANAFDDRVPGKAHVLRPEMHGVLPTADIEVTPLQVDVGRIGVIRNTAAALPESLPQLNHPQVRAIGRDPRGLHDVFRAAGSGLDYATWLSGTVPDRAFDTIQGDRVRLMRGHGKDLEVFAGTKAEMRARVEAGDIDGGKDWEVDTFVDISRPWDDLRGRDSIEQQRLDRAAESGSPQALRAYVFGRDNYGDPVVSYMVRANMGSSKPHSSDLIALLQGTVPEEAYGLTGAILQQFESRAGVPEVHLAVDFGRDESGAVVPVHAVAAEPRLAASDSHPALAMEHATLLARQLIRMAQAEPKVQR